MQALSTSRSSPASASSVRLHRTQAAHRPAPAPAKATSTASGSGTPSRGSTAIGEASHGRAYASCPWSRNGRVLVKNSVGLGIASAPASESPSGTSTAAASPRQRRAIRKSSPIGTSIGLHAIASPTTSPADPHDRRCASSSATGSAAAEMAVQLPISTRFAYGL